MSERHSVAQKIKSVQKKRKLDLSGDNASTLLAPTRCAACRCLLSAYAGLKDIKRPPTRNLLMAMLKETQLLPLPL